MGRFNYDLSNTFGRNSFDYTIKNTANTSMAYSSKTEFDAGALSFSQNTINADLDTKVDVLAGLNLAFGTEGRFENFKISAGERDSYALYDINEAIQSPTTASNLKPTDFCGSTRPGGTGIPWV